LKAVLDKTSGLLNQGEVMTYVAAMQIPTYHKLLFISDTAVILILTSIKKLPC
jgi:predicted metal-dependent RNase